MLKAIFVFMFILMVGVCEEDYLDPVINILLNGLSNDFSDKDQALTADAVWKCGNCSDLGPAQIIHSETNFVEDLLEQDEVDVQISFEVAGMRCVVVNADRPGAVMKVVGSCDSSAVTLSVSPSHNFTVLVYT